MQQKNKILIVGIGNTIRGDDGIGAYVCHKIEQQKINHVETLIVHQLQTELIDMFLQFDIIMIVDASVNVSGVQLYAVKENNTQPISSSHHINPSLLFNLAKELYQKKLNVNICSVEGVNFEMGEELSSVAKKNADAAVKLIVDWINKY